jgi:hypothetical protein
LATFAVAAETAAFPADNAAASFVASVAFKAATWANASDTVVAVFAVVVATEFTPSFITVDVLSPHTTALALVAAPVVGVAAAVFVAAVFVAVAPPPPVVVLVVVTPFIVVVMVLITLLKSLTCDVRLTT